MLTRLHTRYDKETLSEDLIFREAKPAMGGRANWNGTNGDEGASVQPTGGVNNFQGRYIIRHYWTGRSTASSPRYDDWGGPPGNPFGRAAPTAAKGLATAPRGKVVLKTEVRSPVPLLGIAGKPPHRRQNDEMSGAMRRIASASSRSLARASLAAPGRAHAFCGFFVAGSDAKLTNNASQVVLMRKGNRTVMTMSNTYQGPPENFAMVVPVPVVLQKEDVKTLPADVFDRVDSLSAPRLVEYWEQDPCRADRRRSADGAARLRPIGDRRRRRRKARRGPRA